MVSIVKVRISVLVSDIKFSCLPSFKECLVLSNSLSKNGVLELLFSVF